MPTGIDSAAGQQNNPGHGFRPGSDKPYAEPKGTEKEASGKSQNFRDKKTDSKDGGSFNPPGANLVPGFGSGSSKANQENAKPGDPASQGQQQAGNNALKNKLQDVAEKVKESKGDPRKLAASLADEYLHVGNKLVTVLLVVWIILAFLTTLGGFIVGGIPATIILNLLLFSPKTVYTITKYIIDLIPAVGEVAIAVENIGLDKLELKTKGWQKAVIYAYDLVVGGFVILICIIAFASFCYGLQTPSAISNYFGGNILTDTAGNIIDKGLPVPIFNACSQVTGLGNNYSLGVASNPGGPYNPTGGVAQWKDLILAAAQKTDLDPCIIQGIIEQESGGNPNAASTFYPGGGTGPSYYDLDKRGVNDPLEGYYNLEWRNQGHAIGLMQISIYGRPGWSTDWAPNQQGQQDAVPARNPRAGMVPSSYVTKYGLQDYYTVTDLRDPQKNIDLGSVYLRYLIDHNGGNLNAAFAQYYGSAGFYDREVKERVEKCRARSQLP